MSQLRGYGDPYQAVDAVNQSTYDVGWVADSMKKLHSFDQFSPTYIMVPY